MGAVPQLPAYAHLTQEAVQCVAQASSRYQVPELLMHAVLMKENGRTGKCSRNRNGTYDCGLAQINTSWTDYFARHGIRYESIANDACLNIHVSGYILRRNFDQKRDWFKAIVAYNIGPANWTPERYRVGWRYGNDVVRYWWGFQNWVDANARVQRTAVPAYARAPAARDKNAILEFSAEEPNDAPSERTP